MNFNRHSDLEGRHAFLSASKYHWVNYSEERLDEYFLTSMAAAKGTKLHNIAKDLIDEMIKLPRNTKTLNRYVNDAIGFRMTPEQVLAYSVNCFGTADAISFNTNPANQRNLLRIHDLKTGVSKASMLQLIVYTAMFCLEYEYKPHEIDVELRIYQNDDVEIYIPEVDEILVVMDKIVQFDNRIETLKATTL